MKKRDKLGRFIKTGEWKRCAWCGNWIYRMSYRLKERNYCNASCQAKYEYTNGIKNGEDITKKAHEKTRQMVKENQHPFQQYRNRLKVNRELGRRNYGGTELEKYFRRLLNRAEIEAESQYCIRYGEDILGRPRCYFIDFAIPDYRIAIECDGSQWHRDKVREKIRQKRIEELGWTVVRFSGEEINNSPNSCISKIKELVNSN